MCGFVGAVTNGQTELNFILLKKVNDTLRHRGPDGEGFYFSNENARGAPREQGTVALAHRRLKIIDLSEAARQPMSNEEQTIWLVFNGEIYNYRELRHDLEQRGHRFSSQSDSEVILHLYEESEAGCLEHLQGIYAFAIWDGLRNELFLARDRLGVKPLFYSLEGGGVTFASEAKALLKFPHISREINLEALDEYLSCLCISPPPKHLSGNPQTLARTLAPLPEW